MLFALAISVGLRILRVCPEMVPREVLLPYGRSVLRFCSYRWPYHYADMPITVVETPIFFPRKSSNMDKFTKKLTYALQNHFSVV